MEITNLTISPIFLFVLPFFLLLMRKLTNHKTEINLPPGPWKLPFIGSLHHFVSGSLLHHALANLARSHGPVMLIRAGLIDVVIISSTEAVQEMTRAKDVNFSTRSKLPFSDIVLYNSTDIVFSDGVYWRQLRRICNTDLLNTKRVGSFATIRHEEILSMLRAFRIESPDDRTPVNVSMRIALMVNNITCRSAFRERCRRAERFLEIMKQICDASSGFALSDLFPFLSWMDAKQRRKLATINRLLPISQ